MQNETKVATKALYTWSSNQALPAATLRKIDARVKTRQFRPAVMDDVCFFGEDVAVAWMRQFMTESDAARLGGVLPVDVLSSRYAVEVKAGLLGIGPSSQHWRLTFSAARGAEMGRLENMTPEQRRVYRVGKQDRILDRKAELLRELRRMTGRWIAAATVTLIVDPSNRDVDVFWFDGWHKRIGWNSRQAAAAFRGTFAVSWSGRSQKPQ